MYVYIVVHCNTNKIYYNIIIKYYIINDIMSDIYILCYVIY